MKRLILFKGGVETLEFFTEQMAAVWEKMGCSVFWYNLMLQQVSSSALVEFFKAHSSDEWYMFTFNFEGIAGEAGQYRDDGLILMKCMSHTCADFSRKYILNICLQPEQSLIITDV